MYDIIGDIHGHCDELVELLEKMGYRKVGGSWRQDSRKVVFVGDLIDRGPKIREVVGLVRTMVDAGDAHISMGNHEFNALCFHTRHPKESERFLRPHTPHNLKGHKESVASLGSKMVDALGWFRTLPMWLDLGEIKIVHAAWQEKDLATIRLAEEELGKFSVEFLTQATDKVSDLYHAIERTLKGIEIDLPDGVGWKDKDGKERRHMRAQWYRNPDGDTYNSYGLSVSTDFDVSEPVQPEVVAHIEPWHENHVPLFVGHYWMRGNPEPLATNVACVDYSVAKKGALTAYRWSGEVELKAENFVQVAAKR